MPKIFCKIFLLVFFCQHAFVAACFGQNKIAVPDVFVEKAPPEESSDAWLKLNYAIDSEIQVKNINGVLSTSIGRTVYNDTCRFELSNGTILGVDRGEWGGALVFRPKDKTMPDKQLREGNIKFIFRYRGRICFLEGLDHLGGHYGKLMECDSVADSLSFKELFDMDDEPGQYAIYNDKLLVITEEKFFVINNGKIECINNNGFWDGLGPTSIAVFDEENIFFGLRGSMARVNLKTKTFSFFELRK